jgi:hypothetical protein
MATCKTDANGLPCPEVGNPSCTPFELTNTGDDCVISSLVEEHIAIGAATINVFKLLGVHEQGNLVDLAKNGTPLVSGENIKFPSTDAFISNSCEWRSIQKGQGVLASAFLGYDFGEIKLDNGRLRYGIETSVRHHITTIKLKQSPNQKNRATKARVERSDDNITWYGVSIVDIPDNDQLNTISVKQSAPSRYWRIRPIVFNGDTNDYWGVSQLQLIDYASTSIQNIQDELGFLENRDRDYASQSIPMKATYEVQDVQSELTKIGIETSALSLYIHVSFNAAVRSLGRPFVIGDVIEIPSETQFTANLTPIKKYLEVDDVSWSTEGYTPGWKPTMQRLIAKPMLASQETMDIIGDFAGNRDSSGLFDTLIPEYQDLTDINDKIEAASLKMVPERHADIADVTEISDEIIDNAGIFGPNLSKLNINPRGLYVEDAMPPNGETYTQGDVFPTNPNDKDWHRLTYTNLPTGDKIPPRLYKYSVAKNRWIYCETDRRFEYNEMKPSIQSLITSPGSKPISKK